MTHYRIRNWRKHQHFKDRKPPWIKVYNDLLDDPDWHSLNGDSAKLLIGLWLLASEDEKIGGNLPEKRQILFRLRIDDPFFDAHIKNLGRWIEDADINLISTRYQSDTPETETETKGEGEGETHTYADPNRTDIPEESVSIVGALAHTLPESAPKKEGTASEGDKGAVRAGDTAAGILKTLAPQTGTLPAPREKDIGIILEVTGEGEGYREWWQKVTSMMTRTGGLEVLQEAVEYARKCASPSERKAKDLGELKNPGAFIAARCKEHLEKRGQRLPKKPAA